MPYGYRKPTDLPGAIPVFPLDGALVLPRAPLPLNIFEPRYLNMVDDALAGDRVIGMAQTRSGGTDEAPALANVGCLGRLTSFSETQDGRYLITLTGVCRFMVAEELDVVTPYRQVTAQYDAFAQDLSEDVVEGFDRTEFLQVLGRYFKANDLKAEWDAIENAPAEVLINSLSMICPFTPAEKQALLEAVTTHDRLEALVTLMQIDAAPGSDDPPSGLQ